MSDDLELTLKGKAVAYFRIGTNKAGFEMEGPTVALLQNWHVTKRYEERHEDDRSIWLG